MLACYFDRRRGGCFLRAMDGLTFKWWQMKLGSTPRALQASYAKTSAFSLRNSISSSFSRGGSSKPTWKNFSGSTSMATLSRSSHFTSSVGSSLGNGSVVNCYNPLFGRCQGSDNELARDGSHHALSGHSLVLHNLHNLAFRRVLHILV